MLHPDLSRSAVAGRTIAHTLKSGWLSDSCGDVGAAEVAGRRKNASPRPRSGVPRSATGVDGKPLMTAWARLHELPGSLDQTGGAFCFGASTSSGRGPRSAGGS